MQKAKTIKINHRNLGTVSVKIDAEDADIFADNPATIATFDALGCSPKVRFLTMDGRPFASRVILEKHDMLDWNKNVMYKDGDSFNLMKKNLYQTA